jgi:hypothetical protein
MKISAAALLASSLLHVRFTSWSCELPVNAQLPDRPHIHFELVDRGGGMLYKEYLETARTLHRAALKMTDRMIAGQLRALAEDCERRAEKAAQADTAKAPALGGLKSSFPNLALRRDCRPHGQHSSLKGRLERLKTQQPRRKSALSASAN